MAQDDGGAPPWLFSFVDLAFLLLIAMTQLAADPSDDLDLGDIIVPRIQQDSTGQLPTGASQAWQLRVHPPSQYEDGSLEPPFELLLTGGGVLGAEGDMLDKEGLRELRVEHEHIHIERFVSPPDPDRAHVASPARPAAGEVIASITIVLDGDSHEVPYESGEKVLHAVRRAGLEPPFSCEEGYCSCCMAKLVSGEVKMDANDCLTPELLEEGWVLTCQSRCAAGVIRIEYPD